MIKLQNNKYFSLFLSLAASLIFLSGIKVLPVLGAASSTPLANEIKKTKTIIINVPFTSQAPLGQWSDERQQDGCEEAAALMARAWRDKVKSYTKNVWRQKIIALSEWENKKYGEYRDVSLSDMQAWIFKDYFKDSLTEIKIIKSANDLISELEKGNIILMPSNGRALKNPNFTSPGPERHMILIKGYDYQKKQFITNDPGTRRGENYRYSEKIILAAIRPYRTGNKLPFDALVKEVLVVKKK